VRGSPGSTRPKPSPIRECATPRSLRRILNEGGTDAFAIEPCLADQLLRTLARFVFGGATEFSDQEGAALGKQLDAGEGFAARELRQLVVEAFERLGPMRQNPHNLVGGFEDIVEAEHTIASCLGFATARTVAESVMPSVPSERPSRARG